MQSRILLLRLCFFIPLIFSDRSIAQNAHYSMQDFALLEKIDVHTHIHTESLDFVSLAKRDRFRFVNMAVWSSPAAENIEHHRTMYLQYSAEPDRTAPVCSFPLENWDDPDWSQETIRYLDRQFAQGAVGVKVWKNIGMELRDAEGELVMIDAPKLKPVIAHIAACGKVLLGHLGEPKNCWLPLEEMTTKNDRSYFSENPRYHMALRPQMPTYQEQIAARDRMLAQHPNLSFVACHLASLEWSVDEIASFLDRFPNAVVGVAARMGQLQYQSQLNRERVQKFFQRYQDRILYGTDSGIQADRDAAAKYQQVREKWLRDWKYFNTDQQQTVPELDDPVRGLALEKSVVDKLYRDNALRVFAQSWPELSMENNRRQIAALAWLAGNWSGRQADVLTEEVWLPPRNAVMLGMNRTTGPGDKSGFEFLRIAATREGVFYYAAPSGRSPTAFRLLQQHSNAQSHAEAIFENLENDFPQRIIYTASPSGLTARIEGTVGGQLRTRSWQWLRDE